MANLPREYLDDISSQRFQENVARQNNVIQKTVSTNSSSIAANTSAISNLQTQVGNLAKFVDISFSLSNNGSTTQTHNIGTIPSGWTVIDQNLSGFSNEIYSIFRTAWTTTTISFSLFTVNSISSVITLKIRVFK